MRMPSQQALIDAAMTMDCVVQIDALAKEGRQAEALTNLGALAAAAASYLPVIRGVIATQAKAAEAVNLTHHTLAPFFADPSGEEPDGANDQ